MAEMDKVPMTPEGYRRMEEELRRLRTVERPAVVRAIAQAREHGDLSENAEYHAARERQSFIEGRMAELEDKVARAEVIDPAQVSGDKVMFSAQVTVVDEEGDREACYRIVGQDESDIAEGRLSIASPMARAMIGKSVGDQIEVDAPGGARYYEIVKIDYA